MPNDRTAAPRTLRRSLVLLALVPATALLAACGGSSAADSADSAASGGTADELRLGYFANVTHAAALIGVEEGYVADELGDTALKTQVFNAGPDVVEAVFAGALDAAYIGPSPAINAYGQSDGEAPARTPTSRTPRMRRRGGGQAGIQRALLSNPWSRWRRATRRSG